MKKCRFCAEEIQAEAIKCKHCGSDQAAKTQWGKKKGSCLGWLFLLLVGLWVLGAILPDTEPAEPLSQVSTAVLERQVSDLKRTGILKRFDVDANEDRVDSTVWSATSTNQKAALAAALATYCDSKGSTRRIEIYDDTTGQKLGRYTMVLDGGRTDEHWSGADLDGPAAHQVQQGRVGGAVIQLSSRLERLPVLTSLWLKEGGTRGC